MTGWLSWHHLQYYMQASSRQPHLVLYVRDCTLGPPVDPVREGFEGVSYKDAAFGQILVRHPCVAAKLLQVL